MRRSKRSLGIAVAGVLAATALAACGGSSSADKSEASGEWEDIVAKANEEGVVNAYVAWLPTQMEGVEKGFETKYPDIDLKLTRILPPEIDPALDSELKTGGGPDLVSNTNYPWIRAALDADQLAEPLGPEMAGANWAGQDHFIEGKLQTAYLSALGLTWNTEDVAAAPTSYEDLLDPKYRGKVGIVDNINGTMADMYAWLEDTYPGYLEKLKAQEPKVYATAVPIQEALLSGEISIALWGANVLVQDAKSKGAPIDWVLPDEAWAPTILTYLFKESAHPNAAQVLYDYLGSTEGQSLVAKDDLSILPDIPGTAAQATGLTTLDFFRVTEDGWLADAQAAWRKTMDR